MKALVFYNNPIEIPKEESFAVIISLSENNLEDFLTKLIPLYEEIHITIKNNADISPIIQKAMENKVKVILEYQEYKVRVC